MSAAESPHTAEKGGGIALDDLPMGGCSRWRVHQAHINAGSMVCENEPGYDPAPGAPA